MKPVSILASLLLLLASAGPLRADDAAIKPYIGDTTIVVVRIDVQKFDLDAIKTWHDQIFQKTFGKQPTPMSAPLAKMLPTIRQAMDAMVKARGGVAYIVFNFDLRGAWSVLVIPVTPGTDTTELSSLLLKHGQAQPDLTLETATIGSALVYGPIASVERMKTAQPADRPELMSALAAAPDAPVNIAFAPPVALKIMAMTAAPRAQGAMAVILGPLMQNMDWLSVSANLPPQESLTLQLAAKDAQGATTIAVALQPLLDQLRQNQEMAPLAGLLAPIQKENMLTIDIPTAAMEKTVIPIVSKAIVAAMANAVVSQSAAHLKQLLIGCFMYSNEHQGQWPDKLDDIAGEVPNFDQLLINPTRPQAKPGYIYVKPDPAATLAPDQVIVLYEPPDGQKPVAIGYEDGHVQIYPAQQAQDLLKGVGK
ncbi:MAG TPA: hypothetical protein VMD30_08240 [Tepidisphaeraceae bacterium]|nr:hypothetical protein [Tepidisphaeraceae bacterium]